MTLWACVIYDKYWALFLGRPTSMKSADLEIYNLTNKFERLGTCRPAGPEKSMETMIYEALLDLMELAGKITENMDPHRSQTAISDSHTAIDRNQYIRMAALDREFSSWYARLPEQLLWTPNNIATAPFSFFLLHQQYHSSLILLHRPFALYDDQASNENEPDDHFSTLSRTVCTKHAIRVARIYWQHRQRFDTKQIFITGMQHAVRIRTTRLCKRTNINQKLLGHGSNRSRRRPSLHQRPRLARKQHAIPRMPRRRPLRHGLHLPTRGAHVHRPPRRNGRTARRPGPALRDILLHLQTAVEPRARAQKQHHRHGRRHTPSRSALAQKTSNELKQHFASPRKHFRNQA